MKHIKLFEKFSVDDYELIFSYLKDNDDIKVTFGSVEGGASNVVIEATSENACPSCDGGGYIPGDIYCPVCDGRGTLPYFNWDSIKDTIYNLRDNGHNKDIITIRWCSINSLLSDSNDKDQTSLEKFIENIDDNSNKQDIMYIIFFFKT